MIEVGISDRSGPEYADTRAVLTTIMIELKYDCYVTKFYFRGIDRLGNFHLAVRCGETNDEYSIWIKDNA